MLRKAISFFMVLILMIMPVPSAFAESPTASSSEDAHEEKTEKIDSDSIASAKAYAEYLNNKQSSPSGTSEIAFNPGDMIGPKGTGAHDTDSISVAEEDTVTLDVADANGRYNLIIVYDPDPEKTRNIELSVLLDGKLPYQEASGLTLTRMWRNKNGVIETDNNGNDIRPFQQEIPFKERGWMTYTATDVSGYITAPLQFDLTGISKVTLYVSREALRIHTIRFVPVQETISYKDYLESHKNVPDASASLTPIEAELPSWTNDATLTASSDRTSPATSPNKGAKISLNMIGGKNWTTAGNELAWKFTPTETGMYVIRLRCRQNYAQDFYSTRALKINGKYPFSEAADLRFSYSRAWKYVTLSYDNGEYYKFYFEAGNTYTLSLSVTLGDFSKLLGETSAIRDDLNSIYRKLLMIIGSNPDTYRDYKLDELVPDVLAEMSTLADSLDSISDRIQPISGASGNDLEILNKLTLQLRSFYKNPEQIASKFSYFKENIASLTNWIVDASARPLDLDTITIAAPNEAVPNADVGFFKQIIYQAQLFFASFFENYQNLSLSSNTKGGKTITVWSTEGRDQASVYNELIQSSFQPQMEKKYHFPVVVELQLVNSDVILPSLAAGNGPDVLMGTGISQPVDYALRDVCANLYSVAPADEVDSVLTRFRASAYAPFMFNGGLYALPMQQSYPMMFYRWDILREFAIKEPTLESPWTWDDILSILPVLQNNNMSILMETGANTNTSGLSTFAMLLYQNGGSFYTDGNISSALDQDVSISTFKFWTKLYTSYGLPTIFNIANRFRTGESPVVIADLTLYNTLAVSAPEIKGLWKMAMVPGTKQADGQTDFTTYSSSSGSVILSAAKNPEMGWEYLKWLTSADIQKIYCQEMEGLLGTSARFPSANIEAMSGLNWTKDESKMIMAQGNWAKAIPEVPGGYYLSRYLNNAFRQVINSDSVDPKEAILSCAQTIDKEIFQKRSEFNLETSQ